LPEPTQPGPAPPIADGECRNASRATSAPPRLPQAEREWLQRLLIQQLRGRWRRRLIQQQAVRRRRRGESNIDESNSEVALTNQQRRVLRDPEARKNIEILAARLSDAIELNRRRPLSPEVKNRLSELLCEPCKALCLETLLDTRCSVEELLLECADLPLLRQRTAEEYAEEEGTLLTWRRLYGAELPELLSSSPESSSSSVQESTKLRLERFVAARFWLTAREELGGGFVSSTSVTSVLFCCSLGFSSA
jgi:hypothetical protein